MRVPFRFLLPALLLTAPAFAADAYKIDATHSEVGFKVRHLLSRTPGRFSKFTGTIQLDEKNLSKSSVDVSIEVASISTDNASRDGHLKSPDFFDAEKFSAITFKSTAVKEVSKGMLQITGDFTMHGVTKPITFTMASLGTLASPMGTRAGFEGSIKLNRQDFGVKWNKTLDAGGGALLGDDVDITLAIEAVKQVPEPKQ